MSPELLDYLRHIRPRVASTTYTRKHWQVRAFLRWLEREGKSYAEVSRADVERYLASQTCSQQFKQTLCATVREFYDHLRRRSKYPCPQENPADRITFKPDKSVHLPRVPSKAAVGALFARLHGVDSVLGLRDRLAAELAYGSGLRRGELARLNVEDVDLDGGTLRVQGKGEKTRVVPLSATAAQAIRKYLAARHVCRGPLLASFFGKRLSTSGVWQILSQRVGMRPHLLRHACASHMLANGCSVRVIQELLGHSRLTTTTVYTHINRKDLAAVVDRSHPRKTHAQDHGTHNGQQQSAAQPDPVHGLPAGGNGRWERRGS